MKAEKRETTTVSDSPLTVAERIFQLVASTPAGLALNGSALSDELPDQPILLIDLRNLLMSRAVSHQTLDAVWRELVLRARHHGPKWMVGAVGMALPCLYGIARSLTRDYVAGDRDDIDTDVLTAFMATLRTIDLDRPNIRPRLCDAARAAGLRTRRIAESHSGRRAPLSESEPPRAIKGHPDFVLADAVAKGVIGELDAEIIGRTRLEDKPLHEVAAELGLTTAAATKRRQRAEPVLCEAIRSGEVSADVSVTITPAAPLRVGESTTSARSRTTSDTQSHPAKLKGGRGAFPGFARNPMRRPEDAPEVHGITRGMPHGRIQASGKGRRRLRNVLVIAAIVVAIVAVTATIAYAAAKPPTGADQLDNVFDNLRNWLIGLLATLATLMLTIGGLRYLVTGGDPGEVQKAKAALKAAAFGYALAVLAPLFVNVLKHIVGG